MKQGAKKLLTCALVAACIALAAPLGHAFPPAPANRPAAARRAAIPAPARPAGVKPRLKIMPLGDSITFGTPDPARRGYRRLLGVLLSGDGYAATFVGSRSGTRGAAARPDNEGHPGWNIPQLKAGMDSGGWLATYNPDVILLHMGTNDLQEGHAATAPADLAALLDDILDRLPKVHIIVAQIIPYRSGGDADHQSLNAAIVEMVAARAPRVSLADMQNILGPADYADNLHPTAAGYDKMARAWESAIRGALSAPAPRAAIQLTTPVPTASVRLPEK